MVKFKNMPESFIKAINIKLKDIRSHFYRAIARIELEDLMGAILDSRDREELQAYSKHM